ncbi:MAG: TlyA family RNA methyltransferase [Betaproteobacteria bacterium]|nr:MAG: TlyA family RNA methyltransferase [Betaproteobacteria bacterium]
MRADVLLVARGLAPSRTAAQRLIEGGHVFARYGETRSQLIKASATLADDTPIEVRSNELDRYVSRGGLKLEGALRHVELDVTALRCLDVGQSTGGFTDCLLQHGAAHVVGIDVGHDQLNPTLRSDPRVRCIEGVNARDSSAVLNAIASIINPNLSHECPMKHGVQLIVCDLSFISLTKVIPIFHKALDEKAHLLSLVKPQFEVGAANVARGGIVRDVSLFAEVEKNVRAACGAHELQVLDYFESPITGADGNREFFVYAERAA